MVAIVAGNGTGLFNASLNALGGGNAKALGQAGGQAMVNVTNGNLILQFTDNQLSGLGDDIRSTRTYNSQGGFDDYDNDNWRWLAERRAILTGDRGADGSYLTRTTADGHVTFYNWDGEGYKSSEGTGAHDFFTWNDADSTWVWTEGSSRKTETYTADSGLLIRDQDANGTRIDYTYNEWNRLTDITDSSGQALSLEYNSAGKLSRIDTHNPDDGSVMQKVYYTYDDAGRLSSVSTDLTPGDNSIDDGNVYTTRYGYDGDSFRIASITQSDGSIASFTYLAVGDDYRIASVTDGSGTTSFSYDVANARTDLTNAAGQQWTYFYNDQSQLVQVLTPAVNGQRLSTRYAYDADGNLTQITDARNNSIVYGYDARGNRIYERDALGNTITRTFSDDNQLLTEVRYTSPATQDSSTGVWSAPPASSAQVTRYSYDSHDRLRFVISATGTVTEFYYGDNGLLAQEANYGDATYDLSGLAITDSPSEGQVAAWGSQRDWTRYTLKEYSYDYRGNLSMQVNYGKVAPDSYGVLDASASVTQYVYDPYGNLLQTIAKRGADRNTPDILSSTAYDGMGRVISQMDASGTRTTSYNGDGKSIAVTNAAGQTLTQTYDNLGRLTSLIQTANGVPSRTTLYVYDADGRLTMTQDPAGVRSYTFYDEAGRVSAKVDGLGAVVEYVYNEDGQLTQEKDYATTVDTGAWYNGAAVVKTAVSQIRPASSAADRISTRTYDAAGRLSSSAAATGATTSYRYDGRNQLIAQQTGDRLTRYFYDASGRQVGVLDPEGYLKTNAYNAAGDLVQSVRYSAQNTDANRATLTLDQLRPASGYSLQTWYFYDDAKRLIGSVDEQGFVSETVYDEAANTQRTIRYATAFTGSLSVDTNFDTVRTAVAGASQSSTTAFDALGRIGQVTAVDGSVTAYEYDNAGRLIRQTHALGTADERTSRTRYDAYGEVTAQLGGEGSAHVTAGMTDAQVASAFSQYGMTYTYDANGRIASATDAAGNRTLTYYDADGRVVEVINALGEVSETQYDVFGEVTDKTTLANRLAPADVAALTGSTPTPQLKALIQAIRNASQDNHTHSTYDLRGLLTSSTDAMGFVTSFAYDSYGEQTSVTRTVAAGNTITDTASYDKRGLKIGEIEDSSGLVRSTATVYDAFGRPIQHIDGRSLSSTIGYNGDGRIITQTDALGHAVVTQYDAFGRNLRQTDALGKTTTFSYDDSRRATTVTTADGVVITTVKTANGDTLSVTDGLGHTTLYAYNLDGELLTVTDPLGQVSRTAYDAAGRKVSSTDALGRTTTFGYDAANRVVTQTNDAGTQTRYTFDGQGRQLRVIQAANRPEARMTDYAYDADGQLLRVTQDPGGLALVTSYAYDGVGQQVKVSRGTLANPEQQVTLYTFDKLGRRASERLDPNGLNLTTRYVYDGDDNVTRKIDAAGNSTWYVYDGGGRLTDTVDALGGVTHSGYDNNGNVIATTRYAKALDANTLAGLGNYVTAVSPVASANDQTTTYVYDDTGHLRFTRDALNQVTERVYDRAGRVTDTRRYDKAIPAATAATVAATTAALAAVGANALTTHSVYDADGQLLSVTDPAGKTESYTYDAVGNRKTLTNKNGDLWYYNYDDLNRLVEELAPPVPVSSISAMGVVSSALRLTVTSISYDALGQVLSRTQGRLRTSLGAAPGADDLSQARTTGYAYDAVGHQVQVTSPGWYNKSAHAYQQASDGTANTFQVTTTVTYDALGNAVRNRVRVNNAGTAADYVDSYKVYDVLGRVTQDVDALKGVTAYTYDAVGNQTSARRYANGLTSAVPAAGYYQSSDIAAGLTANSGVDRTVTTTYDALGRKVAVQQDYVGVYTVAARSLIGAAPTKVYNYNALGQLVRETQIARNTSGTTVQTGASTVYYYDLTGNRTGSVDALGGYTAMQYNALGQLSRQIEYATPLTSWNENTLPSPSGSAKDRSTRFVYDAMGRTSQVIQEMGQYWQQTTYTGTDAVSTVAAGGDLVLSKVTYDGVGNTLTVTDAAGNVTTTQYNALGEVMVVTEPARATAKIGAVDPFANPLITAAPVTIYQVNAFGQVVGQTRMAGQDAAGNVQGGLTQVDRTVYDAAGYATQQIDANGSARYMWVDVAGRIVVESRAVYVTMAAWTVNGSPKIVSQSIQRGYTYDLLGQQTVTTDWYTDATGAQRTTTNSVLYNRFGEVTVQMVNGYQQVGYTYDQVGHVLQQANAQGLTSVLYDLAGNASYSNLSGDGSTTADDRVTFTTYDLLGRAIEQDLPAFEANSSSDTLNNIGIPVTTPIVRQTYDRWGNMLTHADARGAVTSYTYDQNNKVLTTTLPATYLVNEDGSTIVASMIHESRYDALGNQIQELDLIGPYSGVPTTSILRIRNHVYNAAGQLVRDLDALNYARNYIVDANGNRVGTKDAVGNVLVDSYDAMGRQITHGVITNGVKVTLQTNQYDQAGRLVGETTGASAVEETLTSTPNADGSSTQAGAVGNTKYTIFDERGNIVATRNESNVLHIYAFDAAGHKVSESDGYGAMQTWTYNDADYSRLLTHKDLGSHVYTYTYNAFGQVTNENLATPGVTTQENVSTSYYLNGLVAIQISTRINKAATPTYGVADDAYTKSVTYSYDLNGNQVRQVTGESYVLSAGMVDSHQHIRANTQSVSYETRTQYDALNRIAQFSAPAGTEFAGSLIKTNVTYLQGRDHTVIADGYTLSLTTLATAGSSMAYYYDSLGNRRRVILNSTNQSGTAQQVDNWYKYDLESRVTVADGMLSLGVIVAGKAANAAKGYVLAYDAAGRRISSEQWTATSGSTELFTRTEYGYNNLGQVLSSSTRQIARGAGAATSGNILSIGGATLQFADSYDAVGNRITELDYVAGASSALTTYTYRGDGTQTSQVNYKFVNGAQLRAQASYFAEAGMINAAGLQASYRYVLWNNNGAIYYSGNYSKTYAAFDTYKEATTTATWTLPGSPGTTTSTYTDRGELLQTVATGGTPFTRRFASSMDNQLIARQETNGAVENYLYNQGKTLANVGNAAAPQIIDTIDPISTDYPGKTPTSYVVNSGDTLQSIAMSLWGDASMWYVIADANGLDQSSTLTAGASLTIPNVVSSNHNDSTTFKPYDPGSIIGDTTPSPASPPPPKQHGKKCGGIGSVVMVVVAVVVSVYTAGAASALFAPGATTLSVAAAGSAALSAAAAGTLGASAIGWAGVAGAAVGAALGSAASQLVGEAIGATDKFSWGQVAVSGITGGLTKGFETFAAAGDLGATAQHLANYMQSGGVLGSGYVDKGIFDFVANTAASKIVGLDSKFSWSNVAAAAAASLVGGTVGRGSGLMDMTARGAVSGVTSAYLKDKWFGGGKPDYAQEGIDAFGNALASYVLQKFAPIDQDSANQLDAASIASSVQGSGATIGAPYASLVDSSSIDYAPGSLGSEGAPNIMATADLEGGSSADVYDDDVVVVRPPASEPLGYGESSAVALAQDSSAGVLDRALASLEGMKADAMGYYTNLIDTASSPSEAILGSFGRPLARAGYDIAEGGVNVLRLLIDGEVADAAFDNVTSGVMQVVKHPLDSVASLADKADSYFEKNSLQNIAEDSFSFVAQTLATAGLGMAATGLVSEVAGGTSSVIEEVKNSQFIIRPAAADSLFAPNTLHGSVLINQVYHALGELASRTVRITTVTSEMRARFQQVEYIDPFKNEERIAGLNTKMAVDHIVPVKAIVSMDNFARLTKAQMTDIIQDRINIGNLQLLPAHFNSSKGSSLSWKYYKGKALDPDYIIDLMDKQAQLMLKIDRRIRDYHQQNMGLK